MVHETKVLVITGASRGIGAATALLAANKSYNICVNYIHNKKHAEEIVSSITALGCRAIAVQADISRQEDTDRLFREVDNQLGPVTDLVCSAGFSDKPSLLATMDVNVIRKIIETNLLGNFLCVRAAIKRMAISRGGHGGAIVSISSQSAQSGGNKISPYAAAKAGINNMVIALSRELAGERIRINAVSPGVINTEIIQKQGGEWNATVSKSIPLGRIGEPEEVALAVLWLLSDEASYVNGIVLPVTGGR